MARSGLLAICLFSPVLSRQAHADEPARGALTSAEKAQCQARLTEFNRGAQAYNAKLDEIKALEAEFKVLDAELVMADEIRVAK